MTSSANNECRKLGLARLSAIAAAIVSASGDCTLAQIAPDTTLGSENSRVTSIGPVDQIDGGATRGANLFHSFQEFNVDSGRAAMFTNPAGISNILSRVTGANPSNILGMLGVSGGNANLFLINPNGIIFGPNASLSLNGSFVATTANAIGLASGEIFSANPGEPLPTALLNVNPSAFFFNQIAAKPIVNRSVTSETGLQVPEGRSLLLVGGDVRLEGGQLQALGGRVELGGLAASGSVGLSTNGSLMSLGFTEQMAAEGAPAPRADVYLSNTAKVNVASSNGGSIAINARNVDISAESELRGGIEEGMGFPNATGGDITLNATGEIAIANGFILNTVGTGAVGKGGNIDITAESLSVSNGAQLQANTFGQGNAGSVNIHAPDTVFFDGVGSNRRSSGAYSRVGKEAVGNSGGINITTGSLVLTNGAQLSPSTSGHGNAGSVNIHASRVSFDGAGRNRASSGVLSTVEEGAVGNAGDINVMTGSLALTNGARLNASTEAYGNAANVNIQAARTVSFDGVGSNRFSSGPQSRVAKTAVGNGGNINITAESLSVSNGARLQAVTEGQGDAGNVKINVRDTVSFDGASNIRYSGAFSSVRTEAEGEGGDTEITARSLAFKNGAVLSASTLGQGNGGNITLNANTLEADNGGQVITSSRSSGNAGNITLNVTDSVTLSGSNSTYSARFVELGEELIDIAGSPRIRPYSGRLVELGEELIDIADSPNRPYSDRLAELGEELTDVADSVSGRYIYRLTELGEELIESVGSASGLFANTSENSTGIAGSLRITTGQLFVFDGAQVNVSSEGTGNAGNLEIVSRELLLDNFGTLRATTESGEGGNIQLRSQDLILMRQNSEISTEAGGTGNGGNIDIIDAELLVAVPSEDSNIVANAFEGNGGNINITTSGIFGLEFQEQPTPLSDITASSEFGFDGVVEINTPEVDPSQGLVALPAELVDATGLIASSCGATAGQGESEFIVTGTGGLPPSPSSSLSSDTVWTDLRPIAHSAENIPSSDEATQQTLPTTGQLVEAQGWVINNKGEVVLTASAPTVTPHSPTLPQSTCHTP